MKRLLLSLDDMPLPLRALSAYSALCAWALLAVGVVETGRGTDEGWTLLVCALLLLGAARLMTLPLRAAWWTLVVASAAALVTAVWLGNSASTGSAVALVILSWPSTRVFFGEGTPLPERIRS